MTFPWPSRTGRRAQVDVRREELLDQLAEGVGLFELLELVVEVELVDDLLDVGGEAVQVVGEVGPELLGVVEQATERELGRVVERLLGRLAERPLLVR